MPRITELPVASSGALSGNELVPIVQGGITVYVPASDIAALAAAILGTVDSVNGQMGTVVLDAADVGALADPSLLSGISGITGSEQTTAEQDGVQVQVTLQQIADLANVKGVGFNYTSDAVNTADADPGTGFMRWNNATETSATKLFLSDTGSDGFALAAIFNTLGGQGFLRVQQANQENRWQYWKWSLIETASGYHKLTVTLVANGNTIQDAKNVHLSFVDIGTPDPSTVSGVSNLTGSELLVVEQSGVPVQVTTQQIANLGGGGTGGTELKGLQFTSTTGSTADSDPGNGVFKWNNATESSATILYFDNQTTDGVSLTTFWTGLAATGYVYIVQGDDSTRWQLWKWSSVTDGTGYRKLAVTLQAASASAIADAKTCYCDFDSDGNTGGSGTTGRHLIAVSAGAIVPSATGGCASLVNIATSASHPDLLTLDFDPTTAEFAQFAIAMPKSWNEGTVTAKFVWSHAATTVNFGVAWKLEAVAVSDGDTIDVAYGTGQTATDTGGTTSTQYVSAETSAITVGGTPAAEDVVYFRVSRVPTDGSDTMAIDARLHQVLLYIVTDAENDA